MNLFIGTFCPAHHQHLSDTLISAFCISECNEVIERCLLICILDGKAYCLFEFFFKCCRVLTNIVLYWTTEYRELLAYAKPYRLQSLQVPGSCVPSKHNFIVKLPADNWNIVECLLEQPNCLLLSQYITSRNNRKIHTAREKNSALHCVHKHRLSEFLNHKFLTQEGHDPQPLGSRRIL